MANDVKITSVKIVATADTSKAQKSISGLASKLESLKTAVRGGIKLPDESKINSFAESIGNLKGVRWTTIANGINKVADALERVASVNISSTITKNAKKLASLGGVTNGKAATTAAIQPTTTAAPSGEVSDNAGHNLPPLGWAGHNLPTLGGANNWAGHNLPQLGGNTKDINMWEKGVISANAAVLKFIADTERLNNIKLQIGKGFLDVAKIAGKAAKQVGKFSLAVAKVTASVAIAPFKKLASSVASVTKKFTNFFMAVKRIAIYRAIRFALKEITQAFREGIANLYQYSKAIDGTFAKSMDSLATSALYAKNSLAAMVAPIVNELAPAVDFLVDKFVDLLNTINETVAAMTGASTWTKALKYPVEYAEAADDATKSAKKLRATLLGFDEINRLDDNSKSNRGRGEEGLDYSKMFEEQAVSKQAGGIIGALKEAFASGDFTDIGATLGEKIKTGLDNIPWGQIKERLNKNAQSVGSLLNGLISVEGAGTSLGSTIAEVFDTAVQKLHTFFDTVQWDKVGSFLGDGINGIANPSLSRDIGETLASIINGGVNTLNGFADKVDFDRVGRFAANGVNKAVKNTDTKNLGESISKMVAGALKSASAFLRDTDFEQIGKKIGQFFKGIKWGEVFGSAATAIFNGIRAGFRIVKGLLGELFGGAFEWLKKKFSTAWETVKGVFKEVGSFFTEKWEDIKGAFKSVGTWFSDKFTKGYDNVKGAFKGIGTWFSDRWSDVKDAFKNVASWFSEKFQDAWREVKKPFENVGTFFATVWFSIKQKFTDIGQKIGNTVGRAFAKAINAVLEVTEGVLNTPIKAINKLLGEVNKLPGVNIGKLGTISLGRMDVPEEFAKGGTPATGSLFLAGERGAELISSNRSGTTVTNRDQLAESVEAGNAESNDLLRQGVALLQQLVAKDTTVVNEITTNSITTAMNRQNVRTGRSVVAVG